jgi:hypothetical protein
MTITIPLRALSAILPNWRFTHSQAAATIK